ncbi:MAG: class D sortase [Acidimicrobiales bacterium]
MPGHTTAGSRCPIDPAKRLVAATSSHPGILSIPAIGLTAPVLEGLSDSILSISVGHDPLTVWPGVAGESVLLAHDVSYFSGLSRVRPGDLVTWRLGCYRAVFRVLGTMVTKPGAAIPVPASGSGLALVTCWPTDALFWTPDRFVVGAELVDVQPAVQPRPAPRPSPVRVGVSAPPALVAEGLSLDQAGILAGRLTIAGSPAEAFRQGSGALAAANAAFEEYAAAIRTAVARDRSWWSAIALPGVPMPSPWTLAFQANVRLFVSGMTVDGAVVSSSAATVTLTVEGGVFRVAGVAA